MKTLFVSIDDVGWDLLAAAPTPVLDRFRAASRTFLQAWGGPTCSNCRAKWLTGMQTFRPQNLVFGLKHIEEGDELAPDWPYMLPRAAAPDGSAMIGKWHVADAGRTDHVARCGFGVFEGTMRSLNPKDGEALGVTIDYGTWLATFTDGSQELRTGYATTWVRDRALREVGRGRELVVASFHAPHEPLHVPPSELHTQGNPTTDVGRAIAMLEALDTLLEDLLSAALEGGYAVLVASDNGTAQKLGGGKGSLTEKGLRSPLFLHVPGSAPEEVRTPVDAADVHATLWDLVHGLPPMGTDGVSLLGRTKGKPHVFADLPNKGERRIALPERWDRAVRDARWKLVANDWQPSGEAAGYELYDLAADPDEAVDLAGDPDHADVLSELRAVLRASLR